MDATGRLIPPPIFGILAFETRILTSFFSLQNGLQEPPFFTQVAKTVKHGLKVSIGILQRMKQNILRFLTFFHVSTAIDSQFLF